MRLIFIRHGDPDYEHDNLTEKGKREAALLAERVSKWNNITKVYLSPLGRAKATAEPFLAKLNSNKPTSENPATSSNPYSPIIYDWLQEFYYKTKYPENLPESILPKELAGKETMCWDLMPDFFTSDPLFFDKDKWTDSDFMKAGKIKEKYKMVCNGIDGILAEYGYTRNDQNFYSVENPVPNHNWSEPIPKYHLKAVKDDYPPETTLVFVCHLGVIFTMIAHLTGLSPMQLWQGFYIAPTSITILNSEERKSGQAWFRVERLGDTNHLINGGEPISSSGYFAEVFRQ